MTKPAHRAKPRWLGFLLAALVTALVILFGAGTASAATATAAQTRVGPHTLAAQVLVGPHVGIGAGQRLGNDPSAYDSTLATGVAAKSGGAASVRLGQAGETAVRGAYAVGPKETAVINGRTRIFDGLNKEAVSEVKNVARQSYTRQLRDNVDFARDNGLRFDLYLRRDTIPSGPLSRADLDPFNPLNFRYIP